MEHIDVDCPVTIERVHEIGDLMCNAVEGGTG